MYDDDEILPKIYFNSVADNSRHTFHSCGYEIVKNTTTKKSSKSHSFSFEVRMPHAQKQKQNRKYILIQRLIIIRFISSFNFFFNWSALCVRVCLRACTVMWCRRGTLFAIRYKYIVSFHSNTSSVGESVHIYYVRLAMPYHHIHNTNSELIKYNFSPVRYEYDILTLQR